MRWSRWLRVALMGCIAVAASAHAQPLPLRATSPVDVQEPETLRLVEAAGYSLGAILGPNTASSTADLSRDSAAYRVLAQSVREDVTALRAEMAANGRKLYEVTDGNVGRIIDLGWLNSPIAQFRLTAIVNRLDRRDVAALGGETGCGEIRLIYRLAYTFQDAKLKRRLASRLPFTLNTVFSVAAGPSQDCTQAAGLWLRAQDGTGSVAQIGRAHV